MTLGSPRICIFLVKRGLSRHASVCAPAARRRNFLFKLLFLTEKSRRLVFQPVFYLWAWWQQRQDGMHAIALLNLLSNRLNADSAILPSLSFKTRNASRSSWSPPLSVCAILNALLELRHHLSQKGWPPPTVSSKNGEISMQWPQGTSHLEQLGHFSNPTLTDRGRRDCNSLISSLARSSCFLNSWTITS